MRLRALSREHPRYGFRRIGALLKREGWSVNLKRVHRLWRREGLKVPQVRRKRRRLGHGENSCTRRRSERPDRVWSYDFIHDQTADGRGLKMLPVASDTQVIPPRPIARASAAAQSRRARSSSSGSRLANFVVRACKV